MKTAAGAFILRARAKLNLRLEVGERIGALHSLVSVIAPLKVADQLSFTPALNGFAVSCEGLAIPERINLVWRAAHELGVPPPEVRVSIAKRIPMQAGLGGGSADAAATLLGLARILGERGHPVSSNTVRAAAARLGSDVPAALVPGLKIVAGVGESVTPYRCEPPAWGILLLKPRLGSETARAYTLLDEASVIAQITDDAFDRARATCRAFEAHDFPGLLALLHNDFTGPIEKALPEVASARERLARAGAAGTILCGSGSCVAGFFENFDAARNARDNVFVDTTEWSAVTGFDNT